MTWNAEQTANDLERYLLRKEPPAIGAVEFAINYLRTERTCRVEDGGSVPDQILASETVWFCSECGSPMYNDMKPSFCLYCGAKVVE